MNRSRIPSWLPSGDRNAAGSGRGAIGREESGRGSGVTDGTRTRDIQIHTLGLYQLSYGHRRQMQANGEIPPLSSRDLEGRARSTTVSGPVRLPPWSGFAGERLPSGRWGNDRTGFTGFVRKALADSCRRGSGFNPPPDPLLRSGTRFEYSFGPGLRESCVASRTFGMGWSRSPDLRPVRRDSTRGTSRSRRLSLAGSSRPGAGRTSGRSLHRAPGILGDAEVYCR